LETISTIGSVYTNWGKNLRWVGSYSIPRYFSRASEGDALPLSRNIGKAINSFAHFINDDAVVTAASIATIGHLALGRPRHLSIKKY
jgi:hypothetical protein